MPTAGLHQEVKVQSVFHPSDFSQASEVAFVHALAIALVAEARLTMFHVNETGNAEWQDFPGVRETLCRWELISKDSPKSAVQQLGIEAEKIIAPGRSAVKACLEFLKNHPQDLIVLAVRQDNGHMRWLERPVGKSIARRAGQITLFIPHGVEGFVSRHDATVHLRRILIPVVTNPRPQPSVEAATRLIRNLRLSAGRVDLLHVGPTADVPAVRLPEDTGWTWNMIVRSGDPVETIVQIADQERPDLIIMTTDGPDGFLDGLRGTTSERVLRAVGCPVANLPVGSMLG